MQRRPEVWAGASGEAAASSSLLELGVPAKPPRFSSRPHDIISLLSPSSPCSDASDTGSSATDRSSGLTAPPPPTPLPSVQPMLRRLSSVTLGEDETVQNEDREDGEVVEDAEMVDDGYEPNDDEQAARGLGPHAMPIPLNCMTQERALHPRKRPAPSPASVRGYPSGGGEPFSWKRPHHQPSVASPVEPQAEPDSSSSSTPSSGDTKSSTLAALASNLLRQLEDEAAGTLVVCQPSCLDHHNDTHQESRQRLAVLGGPEGVLLKDRFKDLTWADLDELRPARRADILRVHTPEYVAHLERTCAKLPLQNEEFLVGPLFEPQDEADGKAKRTTLPYSEWLKTDKAHKCFTVEDPPSAGTLDMDSPISQGSFTAARMAAGAVCHAVDKVLSNQFRNAFVVVRPPGHHAGPNGSVEGEGFHLRPEMCTCGFCLLNNVCIGAAYAMTRYGPAYYSTPSSSSSSSSLLGSPSRSLGIERVAIVDFDIHHGNGTEEVIRNLVPHSQNYPLPPSWAPVAFDSYKPWRDAQDAENVFFASIHLYDDDNFYPCSGAGPHGCSPELRDRRTVVNMPLDVLGPKFLDERQKLSSKAQKALMAQASAAFRARVTSQLLPSLRAFHPDLIMLSAGFDGHADDFYYWLSEDDYGWITDQITAVAEDCCDGRIVSVLEGGYNVVPAKAQRPKPTARRATTSSNFHHAAKLHNREVDAEMAPYGSLARSCAAHVAALQRASQS